MKYASHTASKQGSQRLNFRYKSREVTVIFRHLSSLDKFFYIRYGFILEKYRQTGNTCEVRRIQVLGNLGFTLKVMRNRIPSHEI